MSIAAQTTDPAPEQRPSPLPPSVDLRPRLHQWGLGERRQGKRPTCSVFTVVGALEYAVAEARGEGVRLSVDFLNYAGHKATGRAVDGGFFHELWDGFEKYGICPEADQPYREQFDPDLEPSAEALCRAAETRALGLRLTWIKEWDPETGLTDDQLAAIRRTLAEGHPVCGGFRWPKQARWEQGVLQMCPPEEVFDGHSVLLVGYEDRQDQPGGGVFIIRNSGDDGRDGYLSYEYVRAYMNDACWIGA